MAEPAGSAYRWRDLGWETWIAAVRRPGRLVLTGLGTLLGVASLVAVLGVSETAQHQVSDSFDRRRATEVVAEDPEPTETELFTTTGVERLRALDGVVSAGRYRLALDQAEVEGAVGSRSELLPVVEAEPAALDALATRLQEGRLFDRFHQEADHHVAVLGSAAARTLGIDRVDNQRSISVNGTPLTILGVIDDAADPQLLLSVVVPFDTTLAAGTERPARVFVRTVPGAAQTIGRQAPYALVPNTPERVQMLVPPDPRTLRQEIEGNVRSAFVLASVIALVVGIIGIMNATLVSVLQRTNEIGLRRALGARPRHIALLVTTEAAATGLVSGILGAITGLLATAAWSAAKHWQLVLDPTILTLAPAIGAATGILAGLIPATRAARLHPADALRR